VCCAARSLARNQHDGSREVRLEAVSRDEGFGGYPCAGRRERRDRSARSDHRAPEGLVLGRVRPDEPVADECDRRLAGRESAAVSGGVDARSEARDDGLPQPEREPVGERPGFDGRRAAADHGDPGGRQPPSKIERHLVAACPFACPFVSFRVSFNEDAFSV
jgi:hypothetical protein